MKWFIALLLVTINTMAFSAPDNYVGVFYCEDPKLRFVVAEKENNLFLWLPKHTMTLQKNGEGVWQNDRDITLRLYDYHAQLQMPLRTYDNCKLAKNESIWERAKLAGFDFRGIGNEPSWILILENGHKKLYIDFPLNDVTFEANVTYIPEENRTIFKADNPEIKSLVLTNKKCMDSMSGEEFHATVEFEVDSAVLGKRKVQGCGKALH